MKVLLFGASGQLAHDLRALKPADVELIPLTRADMDITDGPRVKEAIINARPDIVIDTAAFHKTEDCEGDPVLTFKVNAIAPRDIAEVCAQTGSAFLFISTDYVFDGAKKPSPYLESDVPLPINTYGVSKYAGELYIRSNLQKYYIIRVASLYGKAGASGKGGNFVYTILKKGREGQKLKVIDDMFMSPTYTHDAALKIWELLKKNAPYGIYHLTNSGHCSWYEFAKAILEIGGIKADITPVPNTEYPTRARRPLWSVLGSEKGVRMRPWKEGLEAFIKGLN